MKDPARIQGKSVFGKRRPYLLKLPSWKWLLAAQKEESVKPQHAYIPGIKHV